MLTKIIAAVVIIAFFFMLTKAGMGMVGKENPLSKAFPIGSSVIVAFLLGLMFIGE